MIDVSYRYKTADLKGGRMMMDPETGIVTLVGAVEEPEQQPVPIGETQFEQEDKPTAPVKKAKAHGKA